MSDIAGTIHIEKDAAGVARHAASFIAAAIARSREPFRLVLAGGSTPRATYEILAHDHTVNWGCVELFFGDERFVPPDNCDSNYRMVRETLLSDAYVRPRGLYEIPTDGTLQSAAERYEEILRQQYGASRLTAGSPLFDLVILGLGEDGHTASLLPGQPVLEDRAHWVAAVPSGRDEPRITLTYTALESSRAIMFLVTGTAKAEAVRRARAGDPALPAGRLYPEGRVEWFLDFTAAGRASSSEMTTHPKEL